MNLWVQYTNIGGGIDPWLFTDAKAHAESGEELAFDIALVKLEPKEFMFPQDEDRGFLMNAGRFRRFNEAPREHRIQMPESVGDMGAYFPLIRDYVAWISENIHADWNMEIINTTDANTVFVLAFSFDDVKDAIHFKMRWYG